MTDEQTAAAIVANFVQVDYSSTNVLSGYAARTPLRDSAAKALDDKAMMVDAIVRALQAARESALDTHANAAVLRMCHEARMMNGIVDYSDPKATGRVRKVLGTLKHTDDGCAIGSMFAAVWCLHAKTKKPYQTTLYAAGSFRPMWSSAEAADAAKESQ